MAGWIRGSLEARNLKSLGHQDSLFLLHMEKSHLSKVFCLSQNTFYLSETFQNIYFDKVFIVKVLIEKEYLGGKGLCQKADLF